MFKIIGPLQQLTRQYPQVYSHMESTSGNKFSLTPPLLIEVPVPTQESESSCICVLDVSILPLSMIFLLDFVIVLTVCYFCCFSFYLYSVFNYLLMKDKIII